MSSSSEGAASQIIVKMINCHNFLVMAKARSETSHLIMAPLNASLLSCGATMLDDDARRLPRTVHFILSLTLKLQSDEFVPSHQSNVLRRPPMNTNPQHSDEKVNRTTTDKQNCDELLGANGAISKMNLLSNVRMQNDVVDDKDTLEHRLSFTYPMFWRHFVDVDIDIKNDTILHLPEEEQRAIIYVYERWRLIGIR